MFSSPFYQCGHEDDEAAAAEFELDFMTFKGKAKPGGGPWRKRRAQMTKRIFLPVVFLLAVGIRAVSPGSEAAQKTGKISVPEILPLKLRYEVGETLYYRLVRQNNNFRIDGTRAGEMRVVAYFTRTRLEDSSDGKVREKFTWKRFEFGQTVGPTPLKLSEFKPGENFSLVYSVNEEEAISKFDFSSLPRTLEGFMFMILSWDAVTFDAAVRPTKNLRIPDEARVGAEFRETREPHDFVFEFPPLVTDSKYTFSGKAWVRILGLTTIRDIPCAIVEFAESENGVEMNLHLQPREFKTRGFEHFWGKTYLSLEDGRVVKGELVGPITMIQDIQMTGRERPDHAELLVIGYLEMDLLSEEEFNAGLKKIAE
jgi:hypothetical protein